MPEQFLQWLPLLTPVFTAGAMVTFLALGAVFPRVQPVVDWKDTGLNIASGAFLFVLRVGLIAAVGLLLGDQGFIDLGFLEGRVWAQGLVVFLLLDFARYWVHYAGHRVPILWRFHRTHHSSEHINATSGLRMHVVDMVQLTMIPLVLFRLLFDLHLAPGVLELVLLVGVVFDAFEHANLRFPLDRPVNKAWNLLFNNPGFHAWHHTRNGHIVDGNYGQALTIWDRIFGTDVTEPQPPPLYGLAPHTHLENSLLGLHLLRDRKP